MKKITVICIMGITVFMCNGLPSYCASILESKHNLSISGTGEIRATNESRVCIFCHTPHNGRRDIPFLWNRSDQTTNYIPYKSSTMHASVGQPTGASKLCLSCHDGTIAMGAVLSRADEIEFLGGIRFLPATRSSYIGSDLSDDHPVSFSYESSRDYGNLELVNVASLPPEIQLDDSGQLQCTACHDPHDDSLGNFLVMSNRFSYLCIGCHSKKGWDSSTHALSSLRWNGQGSDPWPNTSYGTVAENGCENCHQPHTAGNHQRLLKREYEEDNCIVCHNGNVAAESVELELTKPYLHPVQSYNGVHDAAENFTLNGVENHVECEDCHNPHQVNSSTASAPVVAGENVGVLGIDAGGQQVAESQNLYEICFKCHADNTVISEPAITRQIDQVNTRMEFASGNPSYHPVIASTINSYVPSLLPPYSSGSLMYCTDCHGSDDPEGARGPHGSMNEYLLVERYETTDMTRESAEAYALCYKCHDRGVILSGRSGFSLHRKHVENANTPCAVCHDPHGISATQGNADNNGSLINFDVTVVSPNSAGELYYSAMSNAQCSCALLCHEKDHTAHGD
ncbi:cytochrome c3 family protein [Desulfosediminicola flagellatus]|uniref:cytochrome c3 family protein n=1 Tax=Desulfosediminicola flagellatus TaxID=2569541 RepID=UPI0010ABF979|nr:cytochrome c3 family protein [Desulfosediminicola flagellatus]